MLPLSLLETVCIRVPALNIRKFPFSVALPVTVLQLDVLLLLMEFVNGQTCLNLNNLNLFIFFLLVPFCPRIFFFFFVFVLTL